MTPTAVNVAALLDELCRTACVSPAESSDAAAAAVLRQLPVVDEPS